MHSPISERLNEAIKTSEELKVIVPKGSFRFKTQGFNRRFQAYGIG